LGKAGGLLGRGNTEAREGKGEYGSQKDQCWVLWLKKGKIPISSEHDYAFEGKKKKKKKNFSQKKPRLIGFSAVGEKECC